MRWLAFPTFSFLIPHRCFYSFPDSASSLLRTWFHPQLTDCSTWSTAGEFWVCGAAHNAVHFPNTWAFHISYQLLPRVSTSRQKKSGETESERKRVGWWEGTDTAGHPSLWGTYREKWLGWKIISPCLSFYLIKKKHEKEACDWRVDVLGCCKLKMFGSPVIPWLIYFHSK